MSKKTFREGREYYSDDENYKNVVGRITEIREYDNGFGFTIILDEHAGKNDVEIGKFLMPLKSVEELKKNSFALEASEKKYVFTTAFGIFADGWCYPIVGVKEIDESAVYLDFKSGQANYLEYYEENTWVSPIL